MSPPCQTEPAGRRPDEACTPPAIQMQAQKVHLAALEVLFTRDALASSHMERRGTGGESFFSRRQPSSEPQASCVSGRANCVSEVTTINSHCRGVLLSVCLGVTSHQRTASSAFLTPQPPLLRHWTMFTDTNRYENDRVDTRVYPMLRDVLSAKIPLR